MRTHVFSSLQSLIKNQWIVETKSQLAEYRFVHPLLYQTLYDLTPASDKGRLHYSIASYIEDAYEGGYITNSRPALDLLCTLSRVW